MTIAGLCCLRLSSALALLFVCSFPIRAQSLIDVASVRERERGNARPVFERGGIQFQPGRLYAVNAALSDLVEFAYGLAAKSPSIREQLLTGWPRGGFKDRRFDVTLNLTTDAPLTLETRRRVLLELLTTRFGFRAHSEQRSLNVYVLTMVQQGVLGPNLARVDFNCAELPPPDHPKDAQGRSLCRGGNYERGVGRVNVRGSGDIGRLVGALETMTVFADIERNRGLTGLDGRPIVDQTGLQGFFRWEFPSSGELTMNVREHLGLQLTSKKMVVDVVVIDAVRMPIPN